MAPWTALVLLVVLVRGTQSTVHDDTLQPGTSGSAVVEQVERQIKENCIFPDDKVLMRRIAFVESADGKHPDTYRDGYHGGIWQVDELQFVSTQSAEAETALAEFTEKIQEVFGIDWSAVTWEDLRRPLYSSLGARLYIIIQAGSSADVPREIPEQAQFWVDFYNHDGVVDTFVEEANRLEQGCSRRGADIMFVIDGSGSIGSGPFIEVKRFIKGVVEGFEVGENAFRIGLIQYSTIADVEFFMNTYYNKADIMYYIDRIMRYQGGATRTDLALRLMLDEGFSPENGARDRQLGFPRVAVVMTDGVSDYPDSTLVEAFRAHDANITLIAIGVGHEIDEQEVEDIASTPKCSHVYYLDGFDEIAALRYAIERVTCDAPVIIGPGEGTSPEIPPGGSLPCKVTVNELGSTIEVRSLRGSIHYTVAKNTYPSEAYFEKDISVSAGSSGKLFLPYMEDPDVAADISTWYCNIIGDRDNETEVEIDNKPGPGPCEPDPCENGGTCVPGEDGYTCECPDGFSGDQCEINPCEPDPCENGGTCTPGGDNDYTCECPDGFYGDHCEINPCEPEPCQNGGTCIPTGDNSYTCECPDGYVGDQCENPEECPEHAHCECICDEGWTGDNCDIPVINE